MDLLPADDVESIGSGEELAARIYVRLSIREALRHHQLTTLFLYPDDTVVRSGKQEVADGTLPAERPQPGAVAGVRLSSPSTVPSLRISTH
jgi:hypothetical protein